MATLYNHLQSTSGVINQETTEKLRATADIYSMNQMDNLGIEDDNFSGQPMTLDTLVIRLEDIIEEMVGVHLLS
jgi:hypothetical protein